MAKALTLSGSLACVSVFKFKYLYGCKSLEPSPKELPFNSRSLKYIRYCYHYRLFPDFSGRAVACRALNRILETQSAETVAILFS